MRAAPVLLAAVALLLSGCAGVSPEQKREASARMQMGVTYMQQRNLPAALRELSKASELDPGNPEIDMMLGLAFQSRGDLGKAEEYLRIAIGKRPDYAEAHNNLGNLLSQLGRGEEAIREYGQAASNVLYPTPEYAYYNMGREYFRRQNLDKAEETFAKAGVAAEIEVYGAAHGWCPPDSTVYNEPLAEKAWGRLLALYGKALA